MYRITTRPSKGSPNRYTLPFQQQQQSPQQQQSATGDGPARGIQLQQNVRTNLYQQQPIIPSQSQHSPRTYQYQHSQAGGAPPPPSQPPAHLASQNGYRYTPASATNYTASPVVNREQEDEDLEDGTAYYEKNRIKRLQDERVFIQKKTYTKWCNIYLNKAHIEIHDLLKDFGDGILFMKFLEIISGEKLPRPNQGRMRAHKIENLNYCLDFLRRKKIHFENIGAEDIFDQNERLIMGLIWTIILHFTIQNIEIGEQTSGVTKTAKDALLLWCKNKTAGYPNVKVENFSSSWISGLAFNALIHAHRPELINFDHLDPKNAVSNLNNAFDVAENHLKIPQLLDAADVVCDPDSNSIIAYISLYYHYFANENTKITLTKHVSNVVEQLMHHEVLENNYEQILTELMQWIHETVKHMNGRSISHSLTELRNELTLFNNYKKKQKRSKNNVKSDLEATLLCIQSIRKIKDLPPYTPPEGLSVHEIESAWNKLNKTENERHMAFISEIQSRVSKYLKQSDDAENWIKDKMSLVRCEDYGKDLETVELLLSRHTVLEAEIRAYQTDILRLEELVTQIVETQFLVNELSQIFDTQITEETVVSKVLENLILEKRTWLRDNYAELKMHADIRRLSLTEAKKFYIKLKCMEAGTHSSPAIQLQNISVISSSNSFF